MRAKKNEDFTEGRLLLQIIRFAIPLMITGVMQLMFNTADTIMVGRWGGEAPEACETALAAVDSCGSLINLITLLFMNLSLGAGVSVAQDIGAKNNEGITKTVSTAVILSGISSAIVLPVGIIGARPLLTLMGTEPSVLDQATPYMIAYFCGVPANMLYNYCASILRSAGETARPMQYMFAAGVVNVGMNAVMIFGFKLARLAWGSPRRCHCGSPAC